MLAIKTILHPTDFGKSSKYAIELACSLAAEFESHLVVLHVISAPLMDSNGNKGCSDSRDGNMPEEQIEATRPIDDGNLATEILNLAQLCQADMIIMGSHGPEETGRHYTGSVAEFVTRKATCPVLTVATPGDMQPNLDEIMRRAGLDVPRSLTQRR